MEFLIWLEETRLGTTIASSTYLYPAILTLHGVGMAFVVGVNTAISLCVLGVVPNIRLVLLKNYLPIVWWGFVLNLVTGLLLVIAAATRVLTDPLFFFKIAFVILGIVNLAKMQRELTNAVPNDVVPSYSTAVRSGLVVSAALTGRRISRLALASIVYWVAAIALGRLMGYTFFRVWLSV
jgi:hypothetical protein